MALPADSMDICILLQEVRGPTPTTNHKIMRDLLNTIQTMVYIQR